MIIDLITFMQKDKKNDFAEINFSLISEISKPTINVKVTEEEISQLIIDNLSYFNE